MLPMFVQQDLSEVLASLRHAGFGFEESWFAPQFEFRFPKIGSVTAEGVELELRHALEPWHVLAEETVSGGTVRSVDSSLERMQVKLSGLAVESRYAVTCNGRMVPLQLTRRSGGRRGRRAVPCAAPVGHAASHRACAFAAGIQFDRPAARLLDC
jgi:uncharacterized protein (DUF2126 family)